MMAAVDAWCESQMKPAPRAVSVAAARCAELELPPISVTPLMGRFLMLLAQLTSARRVLEIGTLGGYSTAWLAAGMPRGGRLITIEIDPKLAAAAGETFRLAGISEVVEVRCGAGSEELRRLRREHAEQFDVVFIDADKASSALYFDECVELTRTGGVIVVDNVIRAGHVLESAHADPSVTGSRSAIEHMGRSARASATILQTVGAKGHDGFAIAMIGPRTPAATGVHA